MKKLRIYIDTSVVGGCFDKEFHLESNALFKLVHDEEVTLLISDLLLDEISYAPKNIQQILINLSSNSIYSILIGFGHTN